MLMHRYGYHNCPHIAILLCKIESTDASVRSNDGLYLARPCLWAPQRITQQSTSVGERIWSAVVCVVWQIRWERPILLIICCIFYSDILTIFLSTILYTLIQWPIRLPSPVYMQHWWGERLLWWWRAYWLNNHQLMLHFCHIRCSTYWPSTLSFGTPPPKLSTSNQSIAIGEWLVSVFGVIERFNWARSSISWWYWV